MGYSKRSLAWKHKWQISLKFFTTRSCRPKDSRFPKEHICDNKKLRISLTYIMILETCICRILKRIVVSYFNCMAVKIISLTILLNIDDITDYWPALSFLRQLQFIRFYLPTVFLMMHFLEKTIIISFRKLYCGSFGN